MFDLTLFISLRVLLFAGISISSIILAFVYLLSYITKHRLKNCYLYYGTVKHSRLKGGATHSFNYPICFSYLDIDEISTIGWSFWPIFKLDSPWYSFSSLENRHHLNDFPSNEKNSNFDLPIRVRKFVDAKTNGLKTVESISILTHLTYFGYCFNPISIYFLNYNKENINKAVTDNVNKNNKKINQELIIAEVSNTPWIEQHAYVLDESMDKVIVNRDKSSDTFQATWLKEFHVSPFMEMNYEYNFTFSRPDEKIWVRSKLIKLISKEVWFTASFEMSRIPFTPINIMYILLFYPLHTRIIQILIHWEAVKLFMKGVPTFQHPNNVDLHFGFGLTDKHLITFFTSISNYIQCVTNTSSSKVSNKKE